MSETSQAVRHQQLRRAILQLLYARAVEAPQSLIAGVEAREIAGLLDMTAHEFAFNALYLDGKGFITNDRASDGGEYHFNAIMITANGIDVVENPIEMDRHVPITPPTGIHKQRRSRFRSSSN